MSYVDDALQDLRKAYPCVAISALRDRDQPRVVRRLRGDFDRFPAEGFKSGAIQDFLIGKFWPQHRGLFDPNLGNALLADFAAVTVASNLATATATQVERVAREPIVIRGAVLTARFARVPPNRDGTVWKLDGFDNALVVSQTVIAPLAELAFDAKGAGRTASLAFFGRPDLRFVTQAPIKRISSLTGTREFCWPLGFPAQPGMGGRTWARGVVVYWPDDRDATAPLHIDPDGAFAQPLAGNTGPYHQQEIDLNVSPCGERFTLIDDSLTGRNGPCISTGRLGVPAQIDDLPPFTPFVGTRWTDQPQLGSRGNPGVAADAHRFAGEMARYFLDLRDRLGIARPVLPPAIDVAVYVDPAAQPGEWRRISSAVVIANADDNLAPNTMRRWDYCSARSVVDHEMTHAMTYTRCCFDYMLESGALDEALADLFAVLHTGNPEIFDEPWIRSDTIYFNAAPALRSAAWFGALPPEFLQPVDLMERGHYPNHYSQFVRLAARISDAVLRSKPANDHGYIHWNCTIVTRALTMLALSEGTRITNPETGMDARSIGNEAVAGLVFAALQSPLDGWHFVNVDGQETPFAQFRAALLYVATSSQLDADGTKLQAMQIVNVLNATGIGPILSLSPRPGGIADRLMPPFAPDWSLKLAQSGGDDITWRVGDPTPIRVRRSADLTISARVANLGISTDPAKPVLTTFIEQSRDPVSGMPQLFLSTSSGESTEDLAPGASCEIATPAIARGQLAGCVSDAWLGVIASDPWNALRSQASLRAAIASLTGGPPCDIPLNMLLVRLQIVE